jgi:SAM-dependent methyltransferase
VVFLANTIHHVQERDRLFGELHRVLVPGGRFFAWDPLKYNPVIAVYRRLASGVRTEDERPLGVADLALARRFFPDTEARFFWLATQALFLKYFLVDRVNPSGARYWRRILKEDAASLGWWMPLEKLDRLLTAVPGLRWLAWNVVLFGSKQR